MAAHWERKLFDGGCLTIVPSFVLSRRRESTPLISFQLFLSFLDPLLASFPSESYTCALSMDKGKKIALSGKEAKVITLGALTVPPRVGKDVWLVGKLLCREPFLDHTFRSVFHNLWKTRNGVEIRQIEARKISLPNLIMFLIFY